MDLSELVKLFLLEKGSYCSPVTVRYYEKNLEAFLGVFPGLLVDELCRATLMEYLLYLRKRGVKSTSVNTYFRAVRAFCSWLYEEGYLHDDICVRIKMPRSDAEVQLPLTVSEASVVDRCFPPDTPVGVRNYCVFHLMLDCGLRRGEIMRLTFDSFNFEQRIIFIDGKGSRKRAVPLPAFLSWHLLHYVNVYLSGFPRTGIFFRNQDGTCLTKSAVNMFFSRLKVRSGISRLHPHLLRHTFATSYILGGGSLEFLRLLMGHSSYEVTRKYLHLANTAMVLKQDIYQLDKVFFSSGYKI